MLVLNDIDQLPKELKGAVVALGNFDGLHIGHREIIKAAVASRKHSGHPAGIVTFYPHPAQVLGKVDGFRYLLTIEERIERLGDMGLDFCLVVNFTLEFAKITAGEFISLYLHRGLRVSQVITGCNFHFGNNREGNPATLAGQANAHGFSYQVIDKVGYGHTEVSTSLVKELLANGRISRANAMLTSPYTIRGKVTKGKQVAMEMLAVPTANILLSETKVMPLFGVYLVQAIIGRDAFHGIANIGIKPTFGETLPMLETHLFDFAADIYGQDISVEFLAFIRPEQKFSSLDQLKYQIALDTKSAKYLLGNIPACL